MARKENSTPLDIDFTSYTFVYMCGVCHPGGGAAEFDRSGNRYDEFAADPENGITSGGLNSLDGDYFKAKWAESGVLEADCLICHLKGYSNGERKHQINALNFRWAATVGAGFGKVEGRVSEGQVPKVAYDTSIFEKDGKVLLPVVKEVSNENCFFCHRETDWKKRGSSYSDRSDVHIRAGLRCVDCHVTGRRAEDPRIRGREEHQIGKGDDPGTLVRDDLDNTMRRCEDCHSKGILNAPVMRHRGLPPAHLDKIACQTCHIPWRQVKAALVQDASVFNNSPRIMPPPKRIWAFYGPDIRPWNYYGDSLGYPEGIQPFFEFRPVLGWYKERLYPLNRVYTLWIGIKAEGTNGLDYPYMKDFFTMWNQHITDPDNAFPGLKEIKDDNLDGFLEINSPEEISAILASVGSMLAGKGESFAGKEIVFVDGDRYTTDGNNWETIGKKPFEYSPYGSVFKFSHDITPARNALGARGCNDCHSSDSEFFFKEIMTKPFDAGARPLKDTNATFLGYSPAALGLMAFQHETLKSVGLWSLLVVVVLLILHYVVFGPKRVEPRPNDPGPNYPGLVRFNTGERVLHYFLLVLFCVQGITGLITFSALPVSSQTVGEFNTIHRYGGYLLVLNVILVVGMWLRDGLFEKWDWQWLKKFGGYFGYREHLPSGRFNAGQKVFLWMLLLLTAVLAATGLILVWASDSNLRLIAHSLHDIVAFVAILIVMVHAYLGVLADPGTLRAIFEGGVSSGVTKGTPLSVGSERR